MATSNAEKQAKKELKRLRRQSIVSKAKKADQEAENGNDISLQDRLSIIRGGRAGMERKAQMPDRELDMQNKDDEVFLESPLPISMASEMLPIERIEDGIIHTTDGRYVKIMEVMPINFLLKSGDEQAEVIYSFERFLKIGPGNIQMKSLSKKTDLSRYIKKVEEEMATETNENCRELQEDYKELLKRVGTTEAVSRRFFFIFEYDKRNVRGTSIQEVNNYMEMMSDRIVTYLKQCGNTVLVMDNETDATERILFDILNRTANSSTAFAQRLQDVYTYYDVQYGRNATKMIPVTEHFAPRTIDMQHLNYTVIDGVYYDFMYVQSKGYPVHNFNGWFSQLVNAGDGIDIDLFAFRQGRDKMLERIGRRLRWNRVKMNDLSDSTGEFDDVMDSSAAGYYLKDGLKHQQDFYYIATLITITASSLEELKYKRETMKSYLKSLEVEAAYCRNLQEQAFLSYLPLCKLNRTLYMNSRRNILSSGLAGCYPFTSYELSDEDGVMLGTNELNDSLVVTDFFDTERYKNGNISIMGTSGAGKSYLLQTLAMRFRRKHIQTFIIAPDKGHEFARACKNIGGQFIMISAASDQCINVMEIRKRDTSANKKLEGNMLEQSELALKIQSLHIFFDLLIPDMDAEEEQILDEALINTYKKKGITQDNNSLYDPADRSRYREMPILGDVYDELVFMNCRPAERIANIMKRLVTGSAKSFNQQTNVDLDNLYTVIDISTLSGNLLTVGMYIALDYIFSKAKENRTKKKAIIIDEVWELIGSKSNVKAAEHVLEIFKIIRGYGGIAICATQDLNDFFALEDGKYGRGIINACKTKIVLNLEVKEAEDVKKLLNLSEEERKKIVNFERGHGLLSTNNNNVPIHFRTSQKENDLITTDRKELEQLTSYQEAI